ncbi:CPBP family intramembrane glutamic endopeptidase [Gordonia sp. (in: high G+C Gram-positive bacteria)]|jgi:membrane protease YdiL (CAAX protease family)|uniref:CPBP family intramembrane glutamic endopeptidase n=1 Tax=Gordonia sp. (in: high G+C Gram-positive bacteria) TaxID=84139 RepID=UPI00262340C9|nr:CPBP family intramembrane glutamic endopeptidase [Gordonia sp. (in: high G+C Gram-positive bacteria)]HMS74509.1 CPBP family intramembrane metalloprotease [Gordonia sp. (in: high G+C Gram-positive bacteria)]
MVRSRLGSVLWIVATIAILVTANLLVALGQLPTAVHYAVVPVAAVVLVVLARVSGLGWDDLGLARSQIRPSLPYAAAAIGVVVAVVAAVVAVPALRQFFLSEKYNAVLPALFAAGIVIPLHTVIPEELAFRGVLHGRLTHLLGVRYALFVGAFAFGLWHIASSRGLTGGNQGLSGVLGSGTFGQIAGIVGAVVATAVAGLVLSWLRHRSTSLIAPIALHWALNATGAVAAAAAWQFA